MIYKCEICVYSTNIRRSYNLHLQTEKHRQKSEELPLLKKNDNITIINENIDLKKNIDDKNNERHACNICGKSYAHYSSLFKHSKNCNKNKNIESPEVIKLKYELKYKELEFEKKEMALELEKKDMALEKKDMALEYERKEKEFLIKQVEKNDKIIDMNGKIIDMGGKNMNALIQTNMKALDFLNTYHKDTPYLETFEEKFEDPYTFYLDVGMEYDGENFIIDDSPIDRDDFVIVKIVNMENMGQTINYYVTKMIEYYKNSQYPQLQQMWASDTSRTNYTIKSKFSETITGWQTDKCGNIIIDRILNPLLSFTRNLIVAKCGDDDDYVRTIAKEAYISTSKTLNLLADYKYKINNNNIQPEIMKQLTSYMYLDVNKQLKLLKKNKK
jgi:hypothetical protein